MAKVLDVIGQSVQCELNSGKIVEYDIDYFDWDVMPGDEFRFLKNDDGTVTFMQKARQTRSIPLADIDEDNRATDQDVARVATALRQQAFMPQFNQSGPMVRSGIYCPNCGSNNVQVTTMQENRGSTTFSHTKTKSRRQGHGLFWWLFIGWWWWMVDLFLWICFFMPRLILRLFSSPFKKKKYKGESTSVSKTVNDISYRTMCTCQKCGHTWSYYSR